MPNEKKDPPDEDRKKKKMKGIVQPDWYLKQIQHRRHGIEHNNNLGIKREILAGRRGYVGQIKEGGEHDGKKV